MTVHFSQGHFEIIVIQNQKLLFNSLIKRRLKILFITSCCRTIELESWKFSLELIGDIDSESEFFKIAYKYIRKVSLIDVEALRWNNYFLRSTTENILYFSTHENNFRKIQRKTHLSAKGLPRSPTTDMSKRHYSMYWITILVWRTKVLDLFSSTGNISLRVCLKERQNYL
jgi:hypothetical protein